MQTTQSLSCGVVEKSRCCGFPQLIWWLSHESHTHVNLTSFVLGAAISQEPSNWIIVWGLLIWFSSQRPQTAMTLVLFSFRSVTVQNNVKSDFLWIVNLSCKLLLYSNHILELPGKYSKEIRPMMWNWSCTLRRERERKKAEYRDLPLPGRLWNCAQTLSFCWSCLTWQYHSSHNSFFL